MEKKVSLGVQKKRKKPTLTRKKETLVKKVVDYLVSDYHMFASLVFSPLSASLASKSGSSSIEEAEMTNGDMRGKTKRLVEKVEEYLKSDSYMYAPLFVPQLKNTPRGRIRLIGKVSTEVSTRKMTKNNRSSFESSNIRIEDKCSEGDFPEVRTSGDQAKILHRETVKHIVYQNCRSSSAQVKPMRDSHLTTFSESSLFRSLPGWL